MYNPAPIRAQRKGFHQKHCKIRTFGLNIAKIWLEGKSGHRIGNVPIKFIEYAIHDNHIGEQSSLQSLSKRSIDNRQGALFRF